MLSTGQICFPLSSDWDQELFLHRFHYYLNKNLSQVYRHYTAKEDFLRFAKSIFEKRDFLCVPTTDYQFFCVLNPIQKTVIEEKDVMIVCELYATIWKDRDLALASQQFQVCGRMLLMLKSFGLISEQRQSCFLLWCNHLDSRAQMMSFKFLY